MGDMIYIYNALRKSPKIARFGVGNDEEPANRVRQSVWVLCVSCPSANEFSANFFLLLVRSSSNSPQSLEGFRRTLVPNFIQIRQRVNNFPIDPHCKNCPLSATL